MQTHSITYLPVIRTLRHSAWSGRSCVFAVNGNGLSGTVMTSSLTLAKEKLRALFRAGMRIISRGINLDKKQPGYAISSPMVFHIPIPANRQSDRTTLSVCPKQPITTYYNVSRKQRQLPQQRGAGPPRRQQSQQKSQQKSEP